MANEGLGWESPILKMFHNPGGDDCILGGGTTQIVAEIGRSKPSGVTSRNQEITPDDMEIFQNYFTWNLIWMFPKIGVFFNPPKSSHFNKVWNHYFQTPFWGTPIFGGPPIFLGDFN